MPEMSEANGRRRHRPGSGGRHGGLAARNAGLKVVALEAGPRLTVQDHPFDEIRNDIRVTSGSSRRTRVPTTRRNASVAATGRSERSGR